MSFQTVNPTAFAELAFQGLDAARDNNALTWFNLVRPDLFKEADDAYQAAMQHYGEPGEGIPPITHMMECWFNFAIACFYQGLRAGAVTENYRVNLIEALSA